MPDAWRSVARFVRRCVDETSAHLFPSRCFGCGEALTRHQHLGACATCWSELRPITPPSCARCALPLPGDARRDGAARGCCARCCVAPLPLDETVAAVAYDACARRFLLRAKSGVRPELFVVMGAQLAAVAGLSGLPARSDLIVCVPSSWRARWARGFEPAREIARRVSMETGLPLATTALRPRLFAGPAAKGLDASARWAVAGRRFIAGRSAAGKRVLLVDDVVTTGATVAACARLLRAAGALEVRAAIWARTPAPSGRL